MLLNNARKNILVNFRGGLGDFIMLTPLLKNIRKSGRYNLIFVGNSNLHKLISGYDYFKECWYINYGGNAFYKLIAATELFFKFRKLKIHICITPICSCGKFSYLITRLSKAGIRIGFGHEKTTEVYTHIVKINNVERDIEQNLKILDILDIKCVTKDTELIIPKDSFKTAEDYFLKQRINLSKITIAVAPLVKGMKGYSSREWPLDKYIKLIERIIENLNVNIILMGDKNELYKLEKIKESLPSNRVFLQDKSFSIYEATAILRNCALLICNDSGIMHISVAMHTPILSIWGPTTPERKGYLQKNNFVGIRKNNCSPCREYKKPPINCKNQKCFKEISVGEALEACERFLNENAVSK